MHDKIAMHLYSSMLVITINPCLCSLFIQSLFVSFIDDSHCQLFLIVEEEGNFYFNGSQNIWTRGNVYIGVQLSRDSGMGQIAPQTSCGS